jgi:hypothetical protein
MSTIPVIFFSFPIVPMGTRVKSHSDRVELPGPRILEKPWKLDALKGLPEAELAAWYRNMNLGFSPGLNDLQLCYKMDGGDFIFNMSPKRLILPGGGTQIVGSYDKPPDVKLMSAEIVRAILSHTGGGEDFRVDSMSSQRQFLEALVGSQMEMLSKSGVERHGVFENLFGRLRHGSYGMLSRVSVSLNHLKTNSDSKPVPVVAYEVVPTEKPRGEVHCEYHTHMDQVSLYPSQLDLMYLSERRHSSLVIASRQEDGSFAVAEWRMRDGVNVMDGLRRHSKPTENNPFGWVGGDELKGLVDESFERRDYTLKEEAGRVTFHERAKTL